MEILEGQYALDHKLGGKPSKLPLEDKLLMTLECWRECRTCFHIGNSYGYSEAQAYKSIKWVENTLIKSGTFNLPGKKKLHTLDKDVVVLIDVIESPIERPKKRQCKYYSSKKKQHTIKTQVIVNKLTAEIVCICTGKGKIHANTDCPKA